MALVQELFEMAQRGYEERNSDESLSLASFVMSAKKRNVQRIVENSGRHYVSASLSLTIMPSHFVNLEEVI